MARQTSDNFEKKMVSSLSYLNDKVNTLEKRLTKLESNPPIQASKASSSKKAGLIILIVGIFLIVLSAAANYLPGLRYGGYMFTPLGWVGIIVGIILLISSGSGSSNQYIANPEPEKMPAEETPANIKKTSVKKSEKIARQPIKKETKPEGMEANIGMRWFARIGIISLVLSVAFFIVYAITNKIIGPTGQIALGIFIGIVLIILGEIFDRKEKYTGYARTLTGGGFAIIYFAIYAAYIFYKLIPYQWLDILILSVIIVCAIIFALKYNSQIIAAEAFLLGYIVPIIIGNITLFTLFYSVLLSISLVFISYKAGWINLNYGGMALAYIIHGIWLGKNYVSPNTPLIHSIFIIAYIIIFTVLAILIKNPKTQTKKGDIYTSESFIYISFAVGYLFMFMVNLRAELLASLIIMLVGIIALTYRQKLNYLLWVGIAGTYITQVVWVSRNFTEANMLYNIVFSTIYLILFNIASFISKDDTNNVISTIANSAFYYGIIITAILKFYKGTEGLFSLALAIVYLILAYIAYNQEKRYLFNTMVFLCLSYLTLAIPLQLNQNWVTISWAVEALLLLWLSFRLKEDIIRVMSTVVAGIVAFRTLIFDSWMLAKFNPLDLLGSTKIFSFFIVIAIFYAMAYIYSKNKSMFDNYDTYIKYISISLAVAATFFTTLILTMEIANSSSLGNLKQMWISIAWIIQALGILVYGFAAKKRVARIIGIVVFFIAILKIFLVDLSMLDTLSRIVSFFVLGVILLLAAFLYYKFREYI